MLGLLLDLSTLPDVDCVVDLAAAAVDLESATTDDRAPAGCTNHRREYAAV
jgi:hypothetical protein